MIVGANLPIRGERGLSACGALSSPEGRTLSRRADLRGVDSSLEVTGARRDAPKDPVRRYRCHANMNLGNIVCAMLYRGKVAVETREMPVAMR